MRREPRGHLYTCRLDLEKPWGLERHSLPPRWPQTLVGHPLHQTSASLGRGTEPCWAGGKVGGGWVLGPPRENWGRHGDGWGLIATLLFQKALPTTPTLTLTNPPQALPSSAASLASWLFRSCL